MLSSMKVLDQAPKCKILSVESLESTNCYLLKIDIKRDPHNRDWVAYEPESWDIVALSDVKPTCVNDLNRPERYYFPALIKTGLSEDEDNLDTIEIKTLEPLWFDEMKTTISLYAVYLMNINTNNRIWKALHGTNMNILKEVLTVDFSVAVSCDLCTSKELEGVHFHDDIQSLNLNKSQSDAVVSSIALSKCEHRNTVKLIWGPPGTGKTKTVGVLLWLLLKQKCRTLTCAPTNIAVVEVTARLVRLARQLLPHDYYGLGDILIFGNKDRMKIDEEHELVDVFLTYRIKKLKDCFCPFLGWRSQIDSLRRLLENGKIQYYRYLEEFKRNMHAKEGREIEKKKGKKENHNQNRCNKKNKKKIEKKHTEKEDESSDTVLTMVEFIRKKFSPMERGLSSCIDDLCTHLPTSVLSESIVKNMDQVISHLNRLKNLFHTDTLIDQDLKEVFLDTEDKKYVVDSSFVTFLGQAKKECLDILAILRQQMKDLVSYLVSHYKTIIPNIDLDFYDHRPINIMCYQDARLVFCTASSSFRLSSSFDMVVIDEAAQLKECESTIPLQVSGVRHAILIGDEHQLPAMVQSKVSEKAVFGRSLFERLVSLGKKKHLLNIQYRMHPSISLFPNSHFYKKQILDAPNVKESTYRKNFLQGEMYGSYSFISVTQGKEEFGDSHSLKNLLEVAVISDIVARLCKASVASKQKVSIGIISPYKAQVFALKEKVGEKYAKYSDFSVSVRSVDGFQGGEEDVIIFSAVRSNGKGLVGFLSNHQRTNVALTRARYCLWIIGNDSTLINSDSIWNKLVVDAKSRGCFFNSNEDPSLSNVISNASFEHYKLDELLAMNSVLLKEANWKVVFGDDFLKSTRSITNMGTRKNIISLLVKLSSGWRLPSHKKHVDLNTMEGASSKLLEKYKVCGVLNLLWSVDILKENTRSIQVLKFWNIVHLGDISDQVKRLDIIFGNYTVDTMNRCMFRQFQGGLIIPMSWEMTQEAVVTSKAKNKKSRKRLWRQFSSLNLKN